MPFLRPSSHIHASPYAGAEARAAPSSRRRRHLHLSCRRAAGCAQQNAPQTRRGMEIVERRLLATAAASRRRASPASPPTEAPRQEPTPKRSAVKTAARHDAARRRLLRWCKRVRLRGGVTQMPRPPMSSGFSVGDAGVSSIIHAADARVGTAARA